MKIRLIIELDIPDVDPKEDMPLVCAGLLGAIANRTCARGRDGLFDGYLEDPERVLVEYGKYYSEWKTSDGHWSTQGEYQREHSTS